MGLTRNNQPRTVTVEKIRSLIRELLAQKQTAFPSERELAVRTGGSRSVIREILEEMERNNQLLRSANGRIINPQANQIPILFIARGRNMIDNPAWARLWLAFSERAKTTPLAPELCLTRYWPEEIEEDLRGLSRRPEKYLVLCTNLNLEPLIRQWRGEGRNIIFMDEAYLHYGLPVITLDNTRVGELAADELFRHGFRRPALLSPNFSDHSYTPYQLRIAGFIRKCRELGMDFREERDVYEVFHQKGMLQNYIRQTTEIAGQKRYDSLFLTSDDQLPLVLEVFHDQHRSIPGAMGMITLNAQNNAASYNTRVNAVSSATNEIADQLAASILAHADGQIPELPALIKIPPTLHDGETLCIRKPQ